MLLEPDYIDHIDPAVAGIGKAVIAAGERLFIDADPVSPPVIHVRARGTSIAKVVGKKEGREACFAVLLPKAPDDVPRIGGHRAGL